MRAPTTAARVAVESVVEPISRHDANVPRLPSILDFPPIEARVDISHSLPILNIRGGKAENELRSSLLLDLDTSTYLLCNCAMAELISSYRYLSDRHRRVKCCKLFLFRGN